MICYHEVCQYLKEHNYIHLDDFESNMKFLPMYQVFHVHMLVSIHMQALHEQYMQLMHSLQDYTTAHMFH